MKIKLNELKLKELKKIQDEANKELKFKRIMKKRRKKR